MRILAIGDIHGCSKAFDTLLAQVEPQPEDLIITLGDYVDRGPDSRGVIERILKLRETHRVKSLRGNHELMMMAARRDRDHFKEWLYCGGKEALASYAQPGQEGKLADVPADHWFFMDRECLDYYETEGHIFVHANLYPELPLDEQPTYMLQWESLKATIPLQHESGKVVICGHTSQKSGMPLDFGHLICIDTWVYGKGWLTCLDVQTRKIWQANQRGEHRMAWLDEIALHDDET